MATTYSTSSHRAHRPAKPDAWSCAQALVVVIAGVAAWAAAIAVILQL